MSDEDPPNPTAAERAPREEWAKLEAAVRSLPHAEQRFMSYTYRDYIPGTDDQCGCLLGQVVRLTPPMEARYAGTIGGYQEHQNIVRDALKVSLPVVWAAERYNDRYHPSENDEATCRKRYAYVLDRLASFASGKERPWSDPPTVTS